MSAHHRKQCYSGCLVAYRNYCGGPGGDHVEPGRILSASVFRRKLHMDQATHPRTMFEKIWETHVVREMAGQGTLLYIDRHLIHEVTTPQPFAALQAAGRSLRRPDRTFGMVDHSIPTTPVGAYARRSQVPTPDA